jgi:hypothetical protein
VSKKREQQEETFLYKSGGVYFVVIEMHSVILRNHVRDLDGDRMESGYDMCSSRIFIEMLVFRFDIHRQSPLLPDRKLDLHAKDGKAAEITP